VRHAAIAGVGVVLSADWLAGSALKSGKLVEVLPGWTIPGEGGVYVVMPPGKLIPAKTRAFADFITAELRAGAGWSTAKGKADVKSERQRG
jgi:DNA-binding transcriptional LysR family regulator